MSEFDKTLLQHIYDILEVHLGDRVSMNLQGGYIIVTSVLTDGRAMHVLRLERTA